MTQQAMHRQSLEPPRLGGGEREARQHLAHPIVKVESIVIDE
jgi:hypothetical protein